MSTSTAHPRVSEPASTAWDRGAAVAALAGLADPAVELARRWSEQTEASQTRRERSETAQLANLVRDERGLDLAVRFVDKVARPEDARVAARDLSRLDVRDARGFLGPVDRALFGVGALAAPLAPGIVVPIARAKLRAVIGHLVVDSRDPHLARHLARATEQGYRSNVNLLGEAVLGEVEAGHRTSRVQALLARPDVEYVSIKVSSLVSQISTWDTAGTVQRCLERLRPLYRTALAKTPHGFVNLDMEEYRDLDLTIELFTRLLDEEEFHQLEAGIVLQAYLPDALGAMEKLIAYGLARRAAGRAPIKIRIVKGANLAMERVESVLHGWTQAPYGAKVESDANYLLCMERLLRPDLEGAVKVGVASHNLYDLAMAHLLAEQRGVRQSLDVEMLQGMAAAQARVVRETVGSVLLYTPVVAPADFDVAVSYLIRRLEENAEPQNFLHALFSAADDAPAAMADQESRFRHSLAVQPSLRLGPRRSPQRPPVTDSFANTPDSDPALPAVREWALRALTAQAPALTSPVLAGSTAVDAVVRAGLAAHTDWAARSAAERATILREGARRLEAARGELITVMAQEGGKTIAEADPEVSEAIDFARYYADRAADLVAGPMTDGSTFRPDRVVLVTPPWNFPVAIPMGGVLAGLAAGAAVIIKPAHPTPGCVEVGVRALHAAGVPREALQVVRTGDRATAEALVSHPEVDTVILTGSTETAEIFLDSRAEHPRGARVLAETSGKNSLVITPAADLDLAAADLVRSAFGHAGQKCSAASLGILVGSVGSSERFRRQLIDAVSSIRVAWPQDPGAGMGPVIEAPQGKLLRALTMLDEGESWLVEPRQLDGTGRLWSPGLKEGVRPGSWFHRTEVFGPVLGLMNARTLAEAIEWQNAVDLGLTGGLHSLDPEEIATWTEQVEVGNAYLNRHITGAIVQRQPFGGWKASVVGPGAKAGGPNYIAQLGSWTPDGLPTVQGEPGAAVQRLHDRLVALVTEPEERGWLSAAIGSDAYAVEQVFGVERDWAGLGYEANIFRYRRHPSVWLRTDPQARNVQVIRMILAAEALGTRVRVCLDEQTAATLHETTDPAGLEALRVLEEFCDPAESEGRFLRRVRARQVTGRVRLVGGSALAPELTRAGVTVLAGPVLANGRRELLTFLREQAISQTMHRFGHLPVDLQTHS